MYAFAVPNKKVLPKDEADIITLLKQCRTSVADVEKKLGGVTLYSGLDPATAATLKADSSSTIDVTASTIPVPAAHDLFG
jgi:hypothetical protein